MAPTQNHPHSVTVATEVWMLVAFKILSSYYPVLYSQRHLAVSAVSDQSFGGVWFHLDGRNPAEPRMYKPGK